MKTSEIINQISTRHGNKGLANIVCHSIDQLQMNEAYDDLAEIAEYATAAIHNDKAGVA